MSMPGRSSVSCEPRRTERAPSPVLRGRRSASFLLVLGLLILIAGCRNPLLVEVEQSVAAVVRPPEMTAIFPTDASADVAVNTKVISVTFSKNIDARTVTSSSFYVVEVNADSSEGSAIPGTRSVQTETLTFEPSDTLAFDRTYQVVVTTAVRDVDGNPIPETLRWRFTTGVSPDNTAPQNPSVAINGGAEWTNSRMVTLTLNADDDRGVAQMNVSNTNNFGEGNWITYQETHEWELPSTEGSHTVYVRFRDGSNNLSDTASDQIELDSTPPTVTQLALDGGKSASREKTVPMSVVGSDTDAGSGVHEYRVRLGVVAGSSSLDADDVQWLSWQELTDGSGSIVDFSIDPSDWYSSAPELVLGETVTVEVQVRDLAGNVSILSDTDEPGRRTIRWDQDAPGIAEVQPADGATNVVVNAGIIQVTFDEEVDRTTFDADSFSIRLAGSVDPIGGTIGPAEGGTAMTITEISLEQNADYVVRVKGSVTDVAGNALGSDYLWYFSTADAIDDTPPTGSLSLSTGLTATSAAAVTLDVDATDDWNPVRAIKVWGDSDGSQPAFEEEASWQLLPVSLDGYSIGWTLSAGDGTKYIYYKFQDAALNENPVASRLSVGLDTVAPTISAVIIDGGNDYTNDANLAVSLQIDASDATSGIREMRLSNDGIFDDDDPEVGTERWRAWSPVVSNWSIPDGDGQKTVYVQVRDGVNLVSGVQTDSIILDRTPPTVVFSASDALTINAAATQTATINDGNGIADVTWSQVSGPGSVAFSNATAMAPVVSASADGSYVLRVDVVDLAGNAAFGTVDLVWDTEPPAATPVVTVDEYSTSGQPNFSWAAIEGADFYRVSFLGTPDWSNPPDYSETNQTAYAPNAALAEGTHTLRVTAWDNAGNQTSAGSATVTVDTVHPVITNEGTYFLARLPLTIRYDGTDGEIIEGGSGLASLLWEQYSGPSGGTLSITDETTETPTVSVSGAGPDGVYTVRLTAVDVAGNEREAFFPFEWDTTPPSAPQVSGPTATPDTTPTWSWVPSGGGSGTYRYRLDGAAWSAETSALSYTLPPADALSDNTTVVFEVQETDEAGNWSASASISTTIDLTLVAPPQVLGTPLTNNASVTWTWSSGIGEDSGTARYEYRVNGGAWSAQSTAESATFTAGADGPYTIEVQEYRSDGVDTVDVPGVFTTIYDTTPPSAPNVTAVSPTNDTTPTWQWSPGGGDGFGRYRIMLNGDVQATNVTATSFTPSSALGEGAHTLAVQERDEVGNWSISGTRTVTVDTTPPSADSLAIADPSALTAGWAKSTTVNLTIAGSGSPTQMRFVNQGGSWSDWESYSTTRTNWELSSGEGWKYVYVQLRDAAGNTSSSRSAAIQLDTTAPVVGSFAINGGAVSTTSTFVSLNSSVAGAHEMAIVNGTGEPSAWVSYSSVRSWYLTGGVGAKNVRIKYRDLAGNETAVVQDGIHYGAPFLISATKGSTTNGSISVNWTAYGAEIGSTDYLVYTSTTPTGIKTLRTTTSGTSAVLPLTPGTLYYVHILADNSSLGTSDRYSNSSIGFSSNVTVIYNANDSTDSTLASAVKNTLLRNWPADYSSSISGTMPSWSVTLVPESAISSAWLNPTSDDRHIIYGDPVIITHGTTFHNSATRVRNVIDRSAPAGLGRAGVVAMGYGGGKALDTAEIYWNTWGYADQGPTDIGFGESAQFTTDVIHMYTWTSGNSVWRSPLESTSLGSSPTNDTRTQITYTSTSAYGGGYLSPRYSVYRGDRSNPPGGYLYGRDDASELYFPVVRQGRFLFYGFSNMLNRPFTGSIYFVNLIARMDNF